MSTSSSSEASSIKSCDVGSLPCSLEQAELQKGASNYAHNIDDDSARVFERTVVKAFSDKLQAGISVPAYPQLRDMNEMFLSAFQGTQKIEGGNLETEHLTLKSGHDSLPEIQAIQRNSKEIRAHLKEGFQLRLCITGPYTLAYFFPYRTSETYRRLGRALSKIIEKNVFAIKQGKVTVTSIDEPLFGIVDDPTIDRGSEGREALLAAWESMARKARSRNTQSSIHLHCTSDDLFWKIRSLRIIESHVNDPLYETKATKSQLEKQDKELKASIAKTNFDQLIQQKLGSEASGEAIANIWKGISKGATSPEAYLEDARAMKGRLRQIIQRFGKERISWAGPECGLRGFPTYPSAMEYLKCVSKVINAFAEELTRL